ncbi:MAG: 1-phosphofructokinase [Eubacteriales bacterium]|nr:1-phosphofructokinase [Eubacteriales bacterium]
MIYTVTLNPALDYVMKVGNIRYDDINRSESEEIYYGGKGINVSVILTRLGVENKALGFVGGFTGEKLYEMLKKDGIDCDFNILKNGYTRINVKIKAQTELDVNAQGPAIDEEDIALLLEKLDGIKQGDFLVLAGSIPNTLPDDIYERILSRLDGRGINFVVDATGDLLKNVLKYKPFLIKPNHHELGDLFGVEAKSEQDIVFYAKKLQEMGARNVLVSRAKDGATLIDEQGSVTTFENVEGELVNSVGCGDSMVGGFLAGWIEKGDYSYALKLGAACGNATAFSQELATADEIKNVFDIM